MIIPTKIVVPTDFSATAAKALKYALDLSNITGASILHYHVMIPVESPFIGNAAERAQINQNMQQQCLDQMQELLLKTASVEQLSRVDNFVGEAPLHPGILQFASEQGADAIVMGTLGAGGIREALIGSTATRVIKHAHIPVWLVPDEDFPDSVQQIVMAASYLPSTQLWLPQVAALSNLLHSGLTVVHFANTDEFSYNPTVARESFGRFTEACKNILPDQPVQYRLLESEGIIPALETLDQKFSFDLLVMIRQQKDFWEQLMEKSMTRHMACFTRRPLLLLNEQVN